ncbi:MAG: 3-hydroxyacyl-[acyl-carrier-protein] dehydratase FabZ [Candidatus Neomarinimicrobiota bacterium]|nr:3-hydroxyacyl-ACP dehydratase FabZ [Candidatus Neomarinimicrobiota bacterium]MEE3242084.1 3-hydroxyacyl-ACP dehydratase FabZ [Candidatus Neomarinimicrobiota bacterium]GIT57112.1 MAG: 3-hydroxyacyl-[acyl-carrier-protein] dehydratase FabZ [Candidatus Neomarinimicrobiota bacterium]|tara:strand:- start:37 stop:468 length:432 start_codon:yes stop_codon:yes gene_type:complete
MKNIDELLKILPHRYPFIMIDKVIKWDKKKSLQAIKNVSINEPYFQGHFPGKPIFPGVLILESMAQAGSLIISDFVDNPSKKLAYLSKVLNFKIHKNVIPGDQLYIEAKLLQHKMNSFKFSVECFVDQKQVASAEFFATAVDK